MKLQQYTHETIGQGRIVGEYIVSKDRLKWRLKYSVHQLKLTSLLTTTTNATKPTLTQTNLMLCSGQANSADSRLDTNEKNCNMATTHQPLQNILQLISTAIFRNYYLKQWPEFKIKVCQFQNGGILVCVWKENAHRIQQRGLSNVRSDICKGIETIYSSI